MGGSLFFDFFRRYWIPVVVCLVGLAVTGAVTVIDFRGSVSQTLETAEWMVHLKAKKAELLIAQMDDAANIVRRDIEERPGFETVDETLSFVARSKPTLRTVFVVDAAGVIRADSRDSRPGVGIDVSDREYFTAHLTQPIAGLYLGEPVVSRVDGMTTFPASKAVRAPDGRLLAVVAVSVSASHFSSLLQSSLRRSGEDLYLLNPVSQTVVSLKTGRAQPGLATEFDPAFAALRAGVNQGAFVTNPGLGGRVVIAEALRDGAMGFASARSMREVYFEAAEYVLSRVAAGGVLTLLATILVLGHVYRSSQELDRRRTINALRDRLNLATEAGSIGIWDFDTRTGALIWDAMMFQIYGMPTRDGALTFDDWLSTVHEDDKRTIETEFVAALQENRDFNGRFRIVRPDGSVRWLQEFARILRDDAGEVERIVGVDFDVTDEIEAAEALRTEKEKADAANMSKSVFLAQMSHELRTPLNAILGYAQILSIHADELSADQVRSHARTVEEAGRLLLDHVHDILTFSEMEVDDSPVVLEDVDLRQTLAGALRMLHASVNRKGMRISVDAPRYPLRVRGQTRGLLGVWTNLIGNAVKYSPPESEITLRIRDEDPLAIEIEDRGSGIPETDLGRIFEPFERGTGYAARTQPGTGLGLSIARQLVQRFGGAIVIENRRRGGVRVIVTLRRSQVSDAKPRSTDVVAA